MEHLEVLEFDEFDELADGHSFFFFHFVGSHCHRLRTVSKQKNRLNVSIHISDVA